jgi:hypothetical protein
MTSTPSPVVEAYSARAATWPVMGVPAAPAALHHAPPTPAVALVSGPRVLRLYPVAAQEQPCAVLPWYGGVG